MQPTALFIPCYFDGLPRSSGSARIRAKWVADYWDGAEVYNRSMPFGGYDLYVFQKAYLVQQTQTWIRVAARWRDEGKCRLAFDLCDPDFLDAEHERRLLTVLPLFDYAVATTEKIAEYLREYLPTVVIPDRINLAEVELIGGHEPTATKHPRVVWAGYDYNAQVVSGYQKMATDLGLTLDVKTYDRPIPFVDFWRGLLEYDIVLNPSLDVPPFNYKSNNKTIIAQALGLPVATSREDLVLLMDPDHRAWVSWKRKGYVGRKYDVHQSVEQWQWHYGNVVGYESFIERLIDEGGERT